jgi:AcrR family transcriptional regulator
MTTFQRARSEVQREVRRRAILDAAAAMLAEMPVAEVTLNELSRRVGLAKSNVLRYFESREAVLLELLDSAWQEWLTALEAGLDGAVDAAAPPAGRSDQLAAALAMSLAARPVLCDLLSAQAAVLERNVSVHLGELGDQDAERLAAGAVLLAGALWAHAQPSPAVLAAYEADPALAVMRTDFTATTREVLEVLIAGLLARSAR